MDELRLTPAALRDLEDIWRYTAREWGVAQAVQYTDDLNASFQTLVKDPLLAPACDHIRPGYRRMRVARHAIYFRLEENLVLVVRVMHERMDVQRHL